MEEHGRFAAPVMSFSDGRVSSASDPAMVGAAPGGLGTAETTPAAGGRLLLAGERTVAPASTAGN